MKPAPPHTDAGHDAITAELVRVTLGGKPDRPELEVSHGNAAD